MRIVQLATDAREHHHDYDNPRPCFGAAPEALLHGFAQLSETEVHVVSCVRRPVASPEKVAPNTFYHSLIVPKIGWMTTGYQGCIRAVRRKLRKIQPDIVHGQGTERECALGAVFSGFPNVVTIHGNMGAVARAMGASIGSYLWCAAQLERCALARADGLFCNSTYTEQQTRGRARRTWRVPNAVRREFFETPLAPSADAPVFLSVGTIVSYKRQIELLEIGVRLYRAGHCFEWHFIGPADPRDAYAGRFLTAVESERFRPFARYLGEKSKAELISSLDDAGALVHLPSEESFGLVVAEALTRNLKFFGATVGGIPDIAQGVDGVELFSLPDEAGLEKAMARWLAAGCPRPKNAAREMRSRYHPRVIAARHLEIYREVLSTVS